MVKGRPLNDEAENSGSQLPFEDPQRPQADCCHGFPGVNVKVRRRMVVVTHAHDDPEEAADLGHGRLCRSTTGRLKRTRPVAENPGLSPRSSSCLAVEA